MHGHTDIRDAGSRRSSLDYIRQNCKDHIIAAPPHRPTISVIFLKLIKMRGGTREARINVAIETIARDLKAI